MEIYKQQHGNFKSIPDQYFTEQNYFIHSSDTTYPLKNISFAKLFKTKQLQDSNSLFQPVKEDQIDNKTFPEILPVFSSTPRSIGSSKLNLDDKNNNNYLKTRSFSYSSTQWRSANNNSNSYIPKKQSLKRCYSDTEKFRDNTSRDFDELTDSIESLLSETLRNNDKSSLHNSAPDFNTFLDENWQQVLRDLDAAGRLDSKVLEAIYLLRNAHRTGFLQTYFKKDASKENSNRQLTVGDSIKRQDSISSDSDRHEFTSSNDSLVSASLPSSVLYSSLSDSLPSSGRSTPTVRKRPKRPDIKITHHKDYVEIRRPDSIYSVTSDDETNSHDPDFIDISDDMIVKAICESDLLAVPRKGRTNDLSELEETLRDDTPIPKSSMELSNSESESLILSRPESPTSEFLQPFLTNGYKGSLPRDLYKHLSELLHKLSKYESDLQDFTSLQMKFAILQEEKRRLEETLSEYKDKKPILSRKNVSVTEFPQHQKRDVSVQKYLEIITPIAHKHTSTETTKFKETGTQYTNYPTKDATTQQCIFQTDFSSQYNFNQTTFDQGTNTILPKQKTVETQMIVGCNDLSVMAGSSFRDFDDVGVGDYGINTVNSVCQTEKKTLSDNSQQTEKIKSRDFSMEVGCSLSKLNDSGTQITIETNEFCCGENVADIITADQCIDNTVSLTHNLTQTEYTKTKHVAVNTINNVSSVAVGDGDVFNVICDVCSNKKSRDFACGTYVNLDPCCIDDKLCECKKPDTISAGFGDCKTTDICCDRCENLSTKTVAVGDSQVDDILCDRCDNLSLNDIGIGDDKIDDILCEKCVSKNATCDKGIGESTVSKNPCDTCDGNIFNFNTTNQGQNQIPICLYCGNKMDLDDDNLDDSLTAMRESMRNISSGLQRTQANMKLNFDQEETMNMYSSYSRNNSISTKESVLESPASDEHPLTDEEEEIYEESGRNDVIEACQRLHDHFSGSKPLTKPVMLKYMGIIQTLWFKTVKKRRANASVVKSYLDLFRQRVPELLETIVNMSDDEGNTALHYALTYKNFGVVSILLDSGECSVDNVNQAGYSPIMLAALAGFERKNDKYVMQRLLRMGDINKESSDTGQTPLMLAVSRGNLGVVEMLLDSGCDINALDDEGSTALMCACEHGSIQIVKALLANPDCDATIEDNEGSTALSIAMDARRKDLALLIYGSLNFDSRGKIKLSPSKQSLLGLGRRSPSPVIGRK